MTRAALLFCLVSTVAYAQAGVPGVDDWNTKALATYAVLASGAIAWLVREIFALNRARLDDSKAAAKAAEEAKDKAHGEHVEALTNVLVLSQELVDALKESKRTVDLFIRQGGAP